MKQFLAIIFTLLVLIQPMNKLIIFISFKINQEYIAKNLCVNRDEPITVCYGKCQLTKKIKEQEKKEKEYPQIALQKDFNLFYHIDGTADQSTIIATESEYQSNYFIFYHILNPVDIFHPPKV